MKNNTFLFLFVFFVALSNLWANKVIKTAEYVHIIGKDRQVKISFLNQYTAKITPLFVNDTILNTNYAVRKRSAKNIMKLTEDKENFIISSDSLLVQLDKQELLITVIDKISGDTLLRKINYVRPHNYKGFRCYVDSSLAIYGAAQQVSRYNKYGTRFFFFNQEKFAFNYPEHLISLNVSVPYFAFGGKFSVFIDNPSHSNIGTGLGGEENFYFFADDLQPDIYVINNKGLDKLITGYYDITGYQPLPPMWSLGFMQSSMFENHDELNACYNGFTNNNIPLETVILDFLWFGNSENMGNFTWNSGDNWKDVHSVLDKFAEKKVKKVLISEPYMSVVSTNFEEGKKNNYFVKGGGDTLFLSQLFGKDMVLLDFTNPAATEWYVNLYKQRTLEDSLAGWWLDIGEPAMHPDYCEHFNGSRNNVHNIYSNLWTKSLADSLASWTQKRPFILSRAGWAGIHNNYVINWTGDCHSDFNTLYIHTPLNLNAGVSGLGYMHSDIGGFYNQNGVDTTLYIRWLQFGTFSPMMRAHASKSHPPFPYAYGDEGTAICRSFINLRYALLPYIYTMAYENSTKGYPLCRAMNYYENTERFRETDDQYYFGHDILVAPIFDSTDSRKVLFPQGKWINYFTHDAYQGDSEAVVEADLSQMPLFVRAGAIIPNSTKIMNTAYYSRDTLLLNYYYDSSVTKSDGYVYIDDGISINSLRDKQYEIVSFSAEVKDTNIVFHIERNTHKWNDAPKDRVYIINVISKDTISGKACIAGDTSCVRAKRYGNMTTYSMPRVAGNTKINIAKVGELEPNIGDSSNVYEYRLNHIFPNPIEDEINIPLEGIELSAYTLQIYSSKGEKVLELRDIASNSEVLSINLINKYGYNPLSDGAYYGLLRSGNKSYKFQFIKKSR